MNSPKFRWSKVYESSEEELREYLAMRTIQANRFSTEESGESSKHHLEDAARLWCAEGSLTLVIGTDSLSLQPGDGVRIAAGTDYELRAGLTGYVCYISS